MIGGSQGTVWASNSARGISETFKGLLSSNGVSKWGSRERGTRAWTYWRGDFVDQMTIYWSSLSAGTFEGLRKRWAPTNVNQKGSVVSLVNDMILEDLVVERSRSLDDCRHLCDL